jgi:metallo-beta-lactamase family protein
MKAVIARHDNDQFPVCSASACNGAGMVNFVGMEKNISGSIRLRFLGAAGTVTGSKTLLEYEQTKILIDCGLFQGLKNLRLLNREPLDTDVAAINAVIITHAHLDHVGYLPLLVKNGFRGSIFATQPTCDLARVILLDSAKIHEEEARMANTGGYTKHNPAQPLYTIKDAEDALRFFVPVADREWISITPVLKFQLLRNGHILGSTLAEIVCDKKKIVFSGDLGREQSLLLDPPVTVAEADYLVLESTYGDRDHDTVLPDEQLALLVTEAVQAKGNLIIPTFAVERAQEIMLVLNQLKSKNMIPRDVPIYLDSPMGIDVTGIYLKYPGWHTLSPEQCRLITEGTTMVKDFQDTLSIIDDKRSKIIIAGSGMLSGGRVLEYLKTYIGDDRTTLLFVGFQAEGTRGRALLRGAEHIKIHGNYYRVKARIKEIAGFSGHADRSGLLRWVSHFTTKPKKIFLNHGEAKSAEALRKLIEERLGIGCAIPLHNSSFVI